MRWICDFHLPSPASCFVIFDVLRCIFVLLFLIVVGGHRCVVDDDIVGSTTSNHCYVIRLNHKIHQNVWVSMSNYRTQSQVLDVANSEDAAISSWVIHHMFIQYRYDRSSERNGCDTRFTVDLYCGFIHPALVSGTVQSNATAQVSGIYKTS